MTTSFMLNKPIIDVKSIMFIEDSLEPVAIRFLNGDPALEVVV